MAEASPNYISETEYLAAHVDAVKDSSLEAMESRPSFTEHQEALGIPQYTGLEVTAKDSLMAMKVNPAFTDYQERQGVTTHTGIGQKVEESAQGTIYELPQPYKPAAASEAMVTTPRREYVAGALARVIMGEDEPQPARRAYKPGGVARIINGEDATVTEPQPETNRPTPETKLTDKEITALRAEAFNISSEFSRYNYEEANGLQESIDHNLALRYSSKAEALRQTGGNEAERAVLTALYLGATYETGYKREMVDDLTKSTFLSSEEFEVFAKFYNERGQLIAQDATLEQIMEWTNDRLHSDLPAFAKAGYGALRQVYAACAVGTALAARNPSAEMYLQAATGEL